jgi:hypothetical protein
MVNVSVLGSLTGGAGTYTSSLNNVSPGTTIFIEVEAQAAPTTNTNANTGKQTNGTTDSIQSLPTFTLSDSSGNGAFLSSSLTAGVWNQGSGASVGNNGTPSVVVSSWTGNADSIAEIRAIASPGIFINDDTPTVLLTGRFTVGSHTVISAATDGAIYGGSIELSGSPVGISSTTETSGDPLVGYTALSVPEPASLGLLALAIPAILARRRRV